MRKNNWLVILLVILCCSAMLFVDGIWQPGYWAKSGIKVLLFLGAPLVCGIFLRNCSIREVFRPTRQGLLHSLLLGVGVYIIIVGAFFLLRGYVDFSPVLSNLPEGVTGTTFPLVALYISFVNSLLEEFFFRGFAFLVLSKHMKHASLFSAVAFALYHTAMMLGWFPPGIFILALAGLTIGGLIFNRLDRKDGNIYPGWLVHMFANFATNTVGFILFYNLI